ncbi:hypothetical protein F5887DRAFT_934590 [Amanita rubescens]|nr:hypothetical protein F5887DRAFT_934590 [Amanita rubescens]
MAANVHYHRYRSPPPIARSIRFAPLPDPRRSPSLLDDALTPTSPVSDDASSGSSSTSIPRQKRISYPVEHYPVASVPPHVTPISPESDYVSLDTAPRPTSSKRSFLSPFFKKSVITGTASPASSMSLTPTPSIDTSQTKQSSRRFHVSAEDILTLGTIKLFRSVSRNNRYTADNDAPHEWELSRWTSVNSAQSAPASSLTNGSFLGSSLSRSQSTKRPLSSSGTFNGNKQRSGMNGGVSSASNTKHTSRKGVRMLNGRVYGAPKLKSNPFDNVRDEADPEFVEWGYGGMGSVSGGRAAGMSGTRWERLQSGQSPDEPSLDDGGGMGWVRKRREARERIKAKEEGKNEAQAADSCDASAPKPDLESSATAPVANPEENGPKPPIHHPRPSPNITRPPSVASTATPRSNYVIPSEGEHVLRAVTIPAKFQQHHHHRSPSKSTVVFAGDDEVKPDDTPNDRRTESQSEESESEEENDDEEESDSSGFGQSKRITALSAGVEKYARHKEIIERDQMTVMLPVSE